MNRTTFINILTLALLIVGCGDNSTDPKEDIIFRTIHKEPSWSPNGERIVYVHNRFVDCGGNLTPEPSGLYLINRDGTDKTLLIAGINHGPDWSPDGEWITFGTGAQIYKIRADGDSLTQLTFEKRNFRAAWSPDGKQIAYTRSICDGDSTCGLWVTNVDGSINSFLAEYGTFVEWHPVSNKILYMLKAHTKLGEVIGDSLWLFDLEDRSKALLTYLTDINYANSYFKYSRDGGMILFVSQPYGAYMQLWSMSSDGENRRQLTQRSGWAGDWSPDAQQIVFTNPDNGWLWLMDSDGSNWRQLTFIENDSICIPLGSGIFSILESIPEINVYDNFE